jgi:hypothetical protein
MGLPFFGLSRQKDSCGQPISAPGCVFRLRMFDTALRCFYDE